MINNFDFNQLFHFLAVAKYKNFTHAANNIGISQPALSRSIQKLEETLGAELFDRHPRGVKLNKLGVFLQIKAIQIRELVEDTFSEVNDVSEKGEVRVGVIPTIAPYLLPNILKTFIKKHPEIKISIQENTTESLTKQCSDGDIDLAIVALPITKANLEVEPLFKDELILVVPKGHSLEKKKLVKFSDINELPFISLNKQHCLSENISEYCNRKSVSPITIERTNQLATILELVSLDHGISIIPVMAKDLDKSKTRVYKYFKKEKPYRTISLLYNSNRYERSFVKIFKEHVRGISP